MPHSDLHFFWIALISTEGASVRGRDKDLSSPSKNVKFSRENVLFTVYFTCFYEIIKSSTATGMLAWLVTAS